MEDKVICYQDQRDCLSTFFVNSKKFRKLNKRRPLTFTLVAKVPLVRESFALFGDEDGRERLGKIRLQRNGSEMGKS